MRKLLANSIRTAGLAAAALLALAMPALAQFTDPSQYVGVKPELLQQAGIDQKLNNQVPLDLDFRDEHGRTVQLGQFFDGKPVILTLVYYNCPMLCTQVLNALDRSLETLVGNEKHSIVIVGLRVAGLDV